MVTQDELLEQRDKVAYWEKKRQEAADNFDKENKLYGLMLDVCNAEKKLNKVLNGDED